MVPQVQINSKNSFQENIHQQQDDVLYFAFGGGVGEFGANLTAFHFRQTNFWIDAGAGFPATEQTGAERLLPSREVLSRFLPSYIIITHAHEDHIGAIPYLYKYLAQGTTFFLSPFSKAALFAKFRENEQDEKKFKFVEISENQTIETEDIVLSFFFFPHSIPQAFGVGLQLNNADKTKIFFSGDFKLHQEEKRFSAKDLKNFARADYLFCDSTGALSAGVSGNEKEILPNLQRLITKWPGRVFVTTFSSNIFRIRELFVLAKKLSRPVGTIGYSIRNHLGIAFAAKEFDIPVQQLRDPSPKNKRTLWLVAGCQADAGSSLYRLVRGEIPRFKLTEEDLLIYSASKIPGNEKKIYQSLNLAVEQGVRVEGTREAEPSVHVSGHAKTDELKELITILRPHNLVPVHGDALHFQGFADLISELPKRNLPKLNKVAWGVIYSLDKNGIRSFSKIGHTFLCVEADEIHNDFSLFRRRLELAEQGICTLLVKEENFALVRLVYEGVASEKKLKGLQQKLENEIQMILESVLKSPTDKKEKRIREKLYKLNFTYLRKTPFIHLFWV